MSHYLGTHASVSRNVEDQEDVADTLAVQLNIFFKFSFVISVQLNIFFKFSFGISVQKNIFIYSFNVFMP